MRSAVAVRNTTGRNVAARKTSGNIHRNNRTTRNKIKGNKNKANVVNRIKLIALIPLVILMAMLFFGTNVDGQDDIRETKNDYYHELEGRYMEVLKAELSRKGMGSAGITMTSIIDIKGDRTYKVQLHHEKIGKMDEEARESFLEYMATIDFADGETPVVYSIL